MEDQVIVIDRDDSNERAGYLRAFKANDPNDSVMVTLFGYCSPGHSFKTVRETASDARRYYPNMRIFRHGREIKAV